MSELVPLGSGDDFSVDRLRALIRAGGYQEQIISDKIFAPEKIVKLLEEIVAREPRWGRAVFDLSDGLVGDPFQSNLARSEGLEPTEILLPAGRSLRLPERARVAATAVSRSAPPGVLDELSTAGYQMVVEGTAENTLRTYKARRKSFDEYLKMRGLPALDVEPVKPSTLIDWIAYQWRNPLVQTGIPMAPATVALTLAAVRSYALAMMDRDASWVVPYSKEIKKAYRTYCKRWFGAGYRVNQAAATTFDELRVYAEGIDRDVARGKRNIAIILLGFWMAARASEISALWTSEDGQNIRFEQKAMQIYLPFSKTDQDAAGQWVTIPRYDAEPDICAVRAVDEWRRELAAAGHTHGRLFVEMPVGKRPDMYVAGFPGVDPQGISDVTLRWAKKLGIGHRTAHSHRRGAASEARRRGAHLDQIMKMGRWKSERTLLRYIDNMVYEHPLASGG